VVTVGEREKEVNMKKKYKKKGKKAQSGGKCVVHGA